MNTSIAAKTLEEQDRADIRSGDHVTMKCRMPGFYDDEVCRVIEIHNRRTLLRNSVFVESLDGERYGWTSLDNLVMHHG